MKSAVLKKFIVQKPNFIDARRATALIAHESNMVSRAPEYIASSDYLVAKDANENVIGVIGVIEWEHYGLEVVSHVVNKKYRGTGVGTLLLESLLKLPKVKKSKRLFLCTTKVKYYEQFGFGRPASYFITKKLRADCAKCSKGPLGPGYYPCPEIVMEYKN